METARRGESSCWRRFGLARGRPDCPRVAARQTAFWNRSAGATERGSRNSFVALILGRGEELIGLTMLDDKSPVRKKDVMRDLSRKAHSCVTRVLVHAFRHEVANGVEHFRHCFRVERRGDLIEQTSHSGASPTTERLRRAAAAPGKTARIFSLLAETKRYHQQKW